MEKIPQDRLREDPVFQRVLADGLAIQDRFAAEPVYGQTGKGKLKSTGVAEVSAAKHRLGGRQLSTLAEKLAQANDPAEINRFREEIGQGFVGTKSLINPNQLLFGTEV